MAYNNNYQRPQQPRYNAAPPQPVEIRALPLPEWYGKNLDALYDCLTDLSDPTEILLLHAEAMERALGDYALRFERVLRDAAEENRRLTVTRIAN